MDYSEKDKVADKQREIEDAYLQYGSMVLTLVRTCIRDLATVEDIVQDVFLEALRKYDSYKEHPNQVGWLCKTARYKIKEYCRKMQELDMLDIDDEAVEVGENESGYLETELAIYVKESLTQEECTRYFRYFLWGYTIEEIAEMEGVTVNNMRVRLTRLKQKLQNIMRDKSDM